MDADDLLRAAQELRNRDTAARAMAVSIGASLEETLGDVLESFFLDEEVSQRVLESNLGGTYVRIELAYSLGLISGWERSDLHLVRLIRNHFAHRSFPLSFEDQEVVKLTSQFRMPSIEGFGVAQEDPAELFRSVALTLQEILWVRASMAAEERRGAPDEVDPRWFPL